MSDSIDLLERIAEIDPKSKVLFASFTYKQDFFVNHIFPHFKDKSYPLILIDKSEYQKNIHEIGKSKYADRKFFLEQIECRGIFHPKIMLAISGEKVVLWIGSNNLNYEGFLTNAEMVIPICITSNDSSETILIPQIKDLLESLKSLVNRTHHRGPIEEMLVALPDVNPGKKSDVNILHNMNKKSLFSQIFEIIEGPITKVTVISPFTQRIKNSIRG